MSASSDERIVLNVGGIKYETLRSTILSLPHSRLAKQLIDNTLIPISDNEYFIDRNGRTFHYILEYYRTGRLFFSRDEGGTPVDQEILAELDYYDIFPLQFPNKALAIRIEEAVSLFSSLHFEMAARVNRELNLTFFENGNFSVPGVVNYFLGSGMYGLLKEFREDIKSYMESKFSDLKMEIKLIANNPTNGNNSGGGGGNPGPYFHVLMNIEGDYDFGSISDYTCLRSRDP